MNFCLLYSENAGRGAAEILNEKLMKSIAEEIGGDFIVLPSSIHEVIIVPADLGMDRAELEAMIQDVNETQVRPEERLSDKPYQYDSKTHELMRMDKLLDSKEYSGYSVSSRDLNKVLVTLEKNGSLEKANKNRDRVSMRDKLTEKKQEAAKTEKARGQDSPKLKRAATALE